MSNEGNSRREIMPMTLELVEYGHRARNIFSHLDLGREFSWKPETVRTFRDYVKYELSQLNIALRLSRREEIFEIYAPLLKDLQDQIDDFTQTLNELELAHATS